MTALLATSTNGLFDPVHRFFGSNEWLLTRDVLVFFAIVLWLAVGYWVFKDARRRIEDPWLIGLSVVVGLVPPYVGAFVYMLFRPPEYLDDVRERELEMRSMEAQLTKRESLCPVCRAEVQSSFLVCPVCTTRLRQACSVCKAPLEPLWQACPYCTTPAAPAAVATQPGQQLGAALEPRVLRRR